MIKKFCDKCGKETSEIESEFFSGETAEENKCIDFCSECRKLWITKESEFKDKQQRELKKFKDEFFKHSSFTQK